jgi:hypothetical protein
MHGKRARRWATRLVAPVILQWTCHIFRGSGVLSGSAKKGGLVVVRDTRKNYDCLERLLLYDLENTE